MGAELPDLDQLFAERFELRELLRRLPLGPIYRAYDRDVDEQVVVFILSAEAAAAEVVDRVRHKVRTARKLTHRNISRSYDIAQHEGVHYLTYEYIDGVRLREWLTEGPDLGARLEVVAQVAEGLAAAHQSEVLHGNITPGCVMVERGGRAVLGNFGHARFEAAATLAQIGEGTQIDAVAYLAPEQILGREPSPAVDVYALALVAWEMITGAPRYAGDQPVLVANARLEDTLEDLGPGVGDPRIPEALAPVLRAALAGDPEQRSSAASFAHTLRAVVEQLASGSVESERSGPTTEQRRYGSLAVLPFRYRGPADSDYLAEALVEELIDLLSKNRGLQVFASGATAQLTSAAERDPKQLGAQLGVEVIVDGSLLVAGDRLRISARLIEVAGGFQLWHERFEGSTADVFELQDKLAKRIAEALRLELDIIAHRGEADSEAVEHYLRGRGAHLRWSMFGPEGALAHYTRALELAPGFKPALGHLAHGCVLAWFQLRKPDDMDWGARTRAAVDEALRLAPELPETQLAAANLALVDDRPRAAATHVGEALRIAPTFALAHEFLGRICIESGLTSTGVEHLELAIELDPSLSYCLAELARHYVLHGDPAQARACMDRLIARHEFHRPSTAMLHIRMGAWSGDRELIRTGLGYVGAASPRTAGVRHFGEILLADHLDGEREYEQIRGQATGTSPRLKTLVEQLSAELAAFHGDEERALTHIERAAALMLIDLEWLDRCPLFEGLRARGALGEVRTRVRRRSEKIWAAVQKS